MTEDQDLEKYRTFWPRFFAMTLDIVLLLPLGIAVEMLSERYPSAASAVMISFAAGISSCVYHIVMHGVWGQTVGKMLMNVKVVDVSGSPIRFRQAVLRDLPQMTIQILTLIPFAGTYPTSSPEFVMSPLGILAAVWGFADILVFAADRKRRALHDHIAGTVVVRLERVS